MMYISPRQFMINCICLALHSPVNMMRHCKQHNLWATCIFHITYPRYPYSCVSNQGLNLYYLVGCFLTQTFQLYIYMEMYFGVVVVLFIHIWKCIVMSCLTMLCCLKKKTRLSTSVNISNVHVNVMCFAHESSDVILMILQKDSPCGIPCLEIVRCIP